MALSARLSSSKSEDMLKEWVSRKTKPFVKLIYHNWAFYLCSKFHAVLGTLTYSQVKNRKLPMAESLYMLPFLVSSLLSTIFRIEIGLLFAFWWVYPLLVLISGVVKEMSLAIKFKKNVKSMIKIVCIGFQDKIIWKRLLDNNLWLVGRMNHTREPPWTPFITISLFIQDVFRKLLENLSGKWDSQQSSYDWIGYILSHNNSFSHDVPRNNWDINHLAFKGR